MVSTLSTSESTENTEPLPTAVLELSIVVPCFNEESGLEQLHARLASLMERFHAGTISEVILVDDGSTDRTWAGLQERFQGLPWARLVKHPCNRGITAAIRTGIENASSPWVATIDSDCTYDPLQLQELASAITESAAMVTASPYHPDGSVVGVPKWRLALSKLASLGYRSLLRSKLHTYTSCFRIYRKESFIAMPATNDGFVGIAEIAWHLDRSGGAIVEVPAVLTTRKVGFSKMRTLPVIGQHLKLMSRILIARLLNR
ncbi:glycosyltransferase family 2 protein [Pirellulaceae bacterium SH449]